MNKDQEQTKKQKAEALHPIPRERFAHQVQRNPFLDWLLILAVSLLIASALVAVGVYVYLDTGVRLGAPAGERPRSQTAPIDLGALQSVLAEFDSRAAERAALNQGYSGPRDPSLP